jgi:hypothetical protein
MKCANCGAELAPEHRFCEVCGAVRPPFVQRIAESEREFEILRNQHQSGQLDDAALTAELKRLVVHDEDTGYWMIGARTGRWYWFDGQQWAPRQPPAQETLAAEQVSMPPLSAQPVQASTAGPSLGSLTSTSARTSTTVEQRIIQEAAIAPVAGTVAAASSAALPYLQRMLFVAAAGTLGAFLGVLLAYIVGFFCLPDTSAKLLTCLFVQFAFFGAGLGLALGLGCGLLLGGDVRGAGLGILLGALGGITGGILLMAARLSLLPSDLGAGDSPGVLAQSLPVLIYGLALALMVGLLPGLLLRSPSRAISGVVGCCIGAGAVFFLVLVIQGIGIASLDLGLWTGSPLGIAGVTARLAATAWPALLFGSILGAVLGYTSVID